MDKDHNKQHDPQYDGGNGNTYNNTTVRTSVEMHICDLRRFMSLCYSRTGDVVCCRTFGVNRETVTKNAYFRYMCCHVHFPLNF